jgi:hypothetical protein
METLFSSLLTPQVLTISAAIVALLFSLGKMKINEVPLASSRKYKKILPLLPLILGVIAALAPGVLGSGADEPVSIGSKVLIGLWCGLVASQSRNIVKRFFAKEGEK